MTWALISGATGEHVKLLKESRPSHVSYAGRWGMAYIEADLRGELPASWYKIPAMSAALRDGYEGVLWIDADAMFMRNDVSIEQCALNQWNWVINRYYLGRTQGMVVPSCGVFAVTAAGGHLLDLVWAKRDKFAQHGWWEQGAAHDLFGWGGDGYCAFVGETEYTICQSELPRDFNAQPHDPQPHPIVMHWSGMKFDDRLALMKAARCTLGL